MNYHTPRLNLTGSADALVQGNDKNNTPCKDGGNSTANSSAGAYEVDE